jgi:serine/threonine protein kinase
MIGNILRQRYRIIKKLGAGGFGETFLAEDLDIPVSPKPVCVVKKLHPTIIDSEIIRLFEQEAEILYKLGQNHDQIPKLYAYFENDEELYLIQEFIDGYDLRQEISPGKKLSEGDVIQLLRDVLEILVYVHENKVIHRDIKPANIMRRKDGKLILIDFGVVKQINTTIARNSGLTSKTMGIGTYDYMPIEQGYGKPKLSSDIYALGMTAIEALISVPLKKLSEDEDTGEIIWNNLAQVSNNLEQFITKMVRFDWRQRYKNAREGLEELNQVFPIIKAQNILQKSFTICCIKSFSEIISIIKFLQNGISVCLNLTEMIPDDAQRSVDFVAGAIHVLDGHQKRIDERIFLYTNCYDLNHIFSLYKKSIVREVQVFEPRNFEEAIVCSQALRTGYTIVLNLTEMIPSDAQRCVDFVAGSAFCLGGYQERIGESIFRFTPKEYILDENTSTNY